MHRSNLLKRFAVASMAAASIAMATPVQALACTQVYIGPKLTASGDVLYGRAEDYASRHVKIFGVQEATDGKTYTSEESAFNRTVGKTYRYTFVRDAQADWGELAPPYAEAGINEKGVTCSATLTTDFNSKVEAVDPKTKEGLGEYNIADVVLGEAATAREGVEILGDVMDKYGAQDCNQIWVGDANEVWNFQQLSGHQWIAIKISDDVASINPNMGNLQFKVDLADKSVCLHSEGLEETAKKAGTYVTFADGGMDVASSYGETESGAGQNTRYAQGRSYFGNPLTDGTFEVDTSGRVSGVSPEARLLFFTPGRSDYSLYDAQRSLAARGEGTQFNANENSKLYAIGNNRTIESHIFQTRRGMSPDIATIQWEALSRTEFSVYLPSYSALLIEIPGIYDNFETINLSHVGKKESIDSVETALTDADDDTMDYVMMDINTLTYNNRKACAAGVADYLKVVQTQINDQHGIVDEYMRSLPEGERSSLANEAFVVVSTEVFEKMQALRTELRDYINAGDFSVPFKSSDLDGTLAYASRVVRPIITGQPVSASYVQGSGAAALSVETQDLLGAGLDYQWMKSSDGSSWSKCGSSDTYVPQTSTVGETKYKVVVTNADGVSIESDVATVTVSEPVVEEPTGTMYRLYNPNSGEHFYTMSFDECVQVVSAGWRYEGRGWTAPVKSGTPVYRVYNPNAGDHHYTMSAEERDGLVRLGWNDEGIGWYSDDAQGEPLLRLYNPNATSGSHHYTTSQGEHDALVKLGWRDEGIGWYGVKAG
ncbi:hypothetical protein HMPREF1008_00538 [Olsenella sp. oral taxon 809 str. F0356]|uniref:C69 family dipeptidase n=1 Tax=Olsenella sp. oral taxon 809 TaxID=661086 RepID=UPI000231F2EC|nr:C69 family dipeptidase [Olsenella sp. oral taxon 809]EHF02893.1 hypothetical protein HMPREF1008_00538 [Olsenella sp. oral taxon 809 str. F0356]